jgi:uncharacterized protein YigA (DUF484 family)
MRAEDVAHYLQGNPKFFEDYAEFMAHIVIPHPHSGRAISITERQMLSLRDRNRELEGKLAELIQFGEENDAISERMHRLAVGLAAAATLQSVLNALHYHLREDFMVPQVFIRLWDQPKNAGEMPDFVEVGEELQVFAETLQRPYCGSTSGFETAAWFGAEAARMRSQALVALRDSGGTIGMLAMGAEDSQRFYAEMGTLYLERLGELISAALLRAIRLQA